MDFRYGEKGCFGTAPGRSVRAHLRHAVSHAGSRGALTGPFPYSAAWGDIITGVVALPVLWLL